MTAPHPGAPQTDHERRGAHTWLSFPGQDTIPTALPVPPTEGDRIAATRAALREARDAAVIAYRHGTAGRMSLDELHAVLEKVAAAQTALDGEAPRRRLAPRPGRRPVWADCGRFTNGAGR